MSKQKFTSGEKVNPATEQKVITTNFNSSHWPADKPRKKSIRQASGESQDEDRHNAIRHENPQKDEG